MKYATAEGGFVQEHAHRRSWETSAPASTKSEGHAKDTLGAWLGHAEGT